MSHPDTVRHDLGGYVLGGLEADEERAVEAHLAACPECREELAGIAGTPGLLELARHAPPPVPARLREVVVAAASARRRWRHPTRAFAAAVASVAAVAALLGGIAGWLLSPPEPPRVAVPLEQGESFEASGWVTYRASADQVVVELDVEGLDRLAEPGVYEAWLSTHDDEVTSIGQLDPSPAGVASATLVADGPADAYRGFWITAEPDRADPAHDGPTVLAAPVPPPP